MYYMLYLFFTSFFRRKRLGNLRIFGNLLLWIVLACYCLENYLRLVFDLDIKIIGWNWTLGG